MVKIYHTQDYVITHDRVDELVKHLEANGIQTLGSGMTPPHRALNREEQLPNTDKLYNTMVRLPCNETLTDAQIDYVIEKVNEF